MQTVSHAIVFPNVIASHGPNSDVGIFGYHAWATLENANGPICLILMMKEHIFIAKNRSLW